MNCENCNIACGITPQRQSFEYNYEEFSHPFNIVLGLTARCNLSCPYCFVDQHNSDMSLETCFNGIEFALKNSKRENTTSQVIFFGGEPLLKFDELIVPSVEKFHKEVEFGITTNGVLLDEDKVDFFNQYNIHPLLSFDGVPEVQNVQRPGKGFNSFEKILKNIPYILFRFPGTSMRATITKHSIPYLFESYKMMEELGFMYTSWCPNAYEDWSENDYLLFKDQLEQLALYVYDKLLKGHRPPSVRFLSSAVQQLDRYPEGGLKFNNEMKRCGLATTSFSICPNGDISPCQEKISNPTWIVGNVNNSGIDPKKHEEFLNWYWKQMNNFNCEEKCSQKCRTYCFSNICPSRLEDLHFKNSSSTCYYTKALVEVADRIWRLTSGTINPMLRDYFYGGKR